MSDEESGESLAAAVADHASIDWRESERLTGADPELVRQFKIISDIGRGAPRHRCRRSLAQCAGPARAVARSCDGHTHQARARLRRYRRGLVARDVWRDSVVVESERVAVWHLRRSARGGQRARPPRPGTRPALHRHRVGVHDATHDRSAWHGIFDARRIPRAAVLRSLPDAGPVAVRLALPQRAQAALGQDDREELPCRCRRALASRSSCRTRFWG